MLRLVAGDEAARDELKARQGQVAALMCMLLRGEPVRSEVTL
jgi:hypothetical protein